MPVLRVILIVTVASPPWLYVILIITKKEKEQGNISYFLALF